MPGQSRDRAAHTYRCLPGTADERAPGLGRHGRAQTTPGLGCHTSEMHRRLRRAMRWLHTDKRELPQDTGDVTTTR